MEKENKKSYKLILPISITYGHSVKKNKDNKFTINLNSYRQHGGCFFVMNKVKQIFHEQLKEQIDKLPKLNPPIRCNYTVYKKDKRVFDVNNICAIADKFAMDALTEYGKLEDDNYNFYLGFGKCSFGGIDKENQRIEMEIVEVVEVDK